jgi:cell division protein FtsX
MNTQTGTTYTVTTSDNGKIITLNNASAITLTVPTLFAGFNCMIVQLGDGKVTLTASGVTISNRSSNTKTAGANAIATILGLTSTTFISSGDMIP